MLPVKIHIAYKRISSYFFLGITGILTGFTVTLFLASYKDISLYFVFFMLFLSILGFLFFGFLIKILFGSEDHTVLRSFIFIGVLQLVLANTFDESQLIVLDLYVLGFSIAICIGRLGCYAVGCCHGKPAKKGMAYTDKHVKLGFPKRLANTNLIPVQLLESAGLLLIHLVCVYAYFWYYSGVPFLIFIYGYGILRFFLEFYRGDRGRPYLLRFSEAQWTTYLLTSLLSIYLYSFKEHLFSYWMVIYFLAISLISLMYYSSKDKKFNFLKKEKTRNIT